MPIRRELRPLYPRNWPELSRRIRFERAGGECERCHRPHGMELRCLPDGRWYDPRLGTWRDGRGKPARWPDLEDMTRQRTTRVVLAAAHVNHDPTRSGRRNLRAWCQRCHLQHDRTWHLAQRWLTYRMRRALGDCSSGDISADPRPLSCSPKCWPRLPLGLRRRGVRSRSGLGEQARWCRCCRCSERRRLRHIPVACVAASAHLRHCWRREVGSASFRPSKRISPA
jgi:hypothetical protein